MMREIRISTLQPPEQTPAANPKPQKAPQKTPPVKGSNKPNRREK
nr:MAG TPA: hypothetical protein [Caudoviricetes sp.]